MFIENFNNLDQDYITIKSKFMLNEEKIEQFKYNIERLAEFGQINALQDYYHYKKSDESNTFINSIMLNMIGKVDLNMEELFAIGLFLEYATFAETAQRQEATSLLKRDLKNIKTRKMAAARYYARAIEAGKQEMMKYMWDNKYINGIYGERLSEICLTTGRIGGTYEVANRFASEHLKRIYLKCPDDDLIGFLLVNNISRNQAKNLSAKLSFEPFAERQVKSFAFENE